MDIGSLLLGLALLLVIAFLVARPLIEQPSLPDQPASPADQLLAGREQVLTQLRDLDFDNAMSKINEVDYAAQRAQLVAEGVAILKQLDALGVAPGGVEAEIEASVAERRASKPPSVEQRACGQCGTEARPEDRFCARCGSSLPAPAAGLRQAKVQS